jgi:acetolactate synthase-1/2/3 large subunit
LADKGIKYAFVVNGAANAQLIDAFNRNDNINHVAVIHEQGGGFAAEGYAKISGKPGLCVVTSGPGAQNLLASISNFFFDSIPGIFISGQINSKFLRPNKDIRQVGFQESPTVELATPVTKYAKMITNASDIRYELEKAFFLSLNGRPGPVLLDIPMNIQKIEINPDDLIGFDSALFKESYDMDRIKLQIDKFLKDLDESKRPVILVGAGVRGSGAEELILELGRKLKIPIFPTWNALDIITSDYEFYGGRVGTYGGKGRNFGIQNSDLILAIGSRISGRIAGGNVKSFLRNAKKYVVDIDKYLLERKTQQVPFDENILCDARLF